MITTSQWMSLPKEIREALIIKLGIKKSGPTVVAGNKVVSDGVRQQDLMAITEEQINPEPEVIKVEVATQDPPTILAPELPPEPKLEDLPIEMNPLECQICHKVFKAKIGLAGHKRSHKN